MLGTLLKHSIMFKIHWGSVAGSLFQAAGTVVLQETSLEAARLAMLVPLYFVAFRI